jgi:hypothetical protein
LWAVVLRGWQQQSKWRRGLPQARVTYLIELISIDTYLLKRPLIASISTSSDRV